MNNTELISILIELVQTILKNGGKSEIKNRTTTFVYHSLKLELEVPHLRLSFMGDEVGGIKGWPYYSVTINSKSYNFQRNNIVPQDFIDHIAKSIDKLNQDIFYKTTLTPLIENNVMKVYDIHSKRPNRETYVLKRQLINLFKQEIDFHRNKRRNLNKESVKIYQQFLEIKKKLPHSLKYIRNPYITLKKISEGYFEANYRNGDIVLAGWGNDPYQPIRLLERNLREELSNFGKNIRVIKALRAYYNLFDEDLDELKKKLDIL